MSPQSTSVSQIVYTWLKPLFVLLVLLLAASSLQAQGPGSGGPTPIAVPIDGGASLLLAAGAAYGLNRLRKMRR